MRTRLAHEFFQFWFLGFIEFIVEPSLALCSDMLEAILGPPKVEEGAPENRNDVLKPWISMLAINKKNWREQAAEGETLISEPNRKLKSYQ